jgi:hypothetical protein
VTVRIPEHAHTQESVRVVIRGGAAEKTLVTQLRTVPLAELSVGPMVPNGGEYLVTVRVKNNSSASQSWVLRTELPQGWIAEPASLPITARAKEEIRQTLRLRIPAEKAEQPGRVVLASPQGGIVSRGVIAPPYWELPKVRELRIDGELNDWPAESWLPEWLLGIRGEPARVRIALAYNETGLFVAVEVQGHDGRVTDPRSFWAQTCLEIFLDTAGDRRPRKAYQPGDHQFWLCPLAEAGKVYVGQWKRGTEIPETLYDLQGIQGASRKTPDGWVMEVFLPADRFHGWRTAPGTIWGLNLNLTLPQAGGKTEVYWPSPKDEQAPDRPELWGQVRLR